MTKSRIRDQFLYALLAVIFAAVAVVVTWNWSGTQLQMTNKPAGRQEMVVNANTSDDLMRELNKTVDESWNGDLQSLRQDAGSL